MTTLSPPRFDHLIVMSDRWGTFEHAALSRPRVEHGYCTDDMARVLVVAIREARPSPDVRWLTDLSLRFLRDAQGLDGDYRNRRNSRGRWTDRPTVEDCWGRSVWALGTAAAHADRPWTRQIATIEFERAARRRSPWPRAMAYAAIGAAEVLGVMPEHREARALLAAAADALPRGSGAAWPWPEARLTYANAVLPEAMIAAGSALARPELLQRGLDLLGWLVDHETNAGHFSPTPAGGDGPGADRPAFDQQPIEVAALAEACARAAAADPGDHRWPDGIADAAAWFAGDNDADSAMFDPDTGGGYDGLHADGPNRNQGAESTLALLSTQQHAHDLAPVPT